MLLKFSNELDCDDDSKKKIFDLDRCCKCLKMRRNMMDLMLRQELNSEEQYLTKSNSQKHLDLLKKQKKEKKENKKEEIIKNHNDNIYNNLISKEEKNIINNDISKEQNLASKIQENNFENINNINIKEEEEKLKKDNLDIINQQNYNKIIKKENKLNTKNIQKNSIDLNTDKNEIKLSESDNNVKSISNNPISNFFGIGNNMNISPLNQFETFSVDSENDNVKNIKKKSISFHSSSSLKKNFVLKTEIYKSDKQKNIHIKNNNYSDNPVINYYSGKHFSNFANFYMADIKSPEEIDDNNYINFFPTKEKPEENNLKEKDYISYSSTDNKKKDIKENNNIFEEDNIDDKLKLEKLTLVNTDSLENKLNLDFINNSSSIIDDNSNNNQIEIKDNNKGKNINDINIQNDNFNNINNNNDFSFPLSKNQNNNNNNYINFDINNINNFNNINAIDNKNIINNDFNNINNQNSFNFNNNNNNNNFLNINDINNLKEIDFNKDFLSELSKIDITFLINNMNIIKLKIKNVK